MTRKKPTPKRARGQSVDAFLSRMATTPTRGQCSICKHPARKAIEADCRRFALHRKKGTTHIRFGTFVSSYLRGEHRINGWADGIRRHMEKCCGSPIP